MPASRRVVLAAAAAAAALAVLASPAAAVVPTSAEGEVVRYAHATDALPAGAWARARAVETGSGKTVVTLQVRGFEANETYGAHAHYKPCGSATAPLATGAHYQHHIDPAVLATAAATAVDYRTIASIDPLYANEENEVWLDLTTDGDGNGSAQTVVPWQFRTDADLTARSIVVHVNHTSHGGTPPAGNAGARLGCLTVAL